MIIQSGRIEFTTDHPASRYGIPVLLVDGHEVRPADIVNLNDSPESQAIFGTDPCLHTGASLAKHEAEKCDPEPMPGNYRPIHSASEIEALRNFCRQWPAGPQID